MIKTSIILILFTLYMVCADEPKAVNREERKQFRYVDDEEQVQPLPQRHQQNYAIPQYDDQTERRPLVSVNKDNNALGKNVGVGVNLGRTFQMDLQRDKSLGSQALNLGLNVLNGLVRVNVQRDRDAFSGKRGPILVEVGGHTIYNSGQRK